MAVITIEGTETPSVYLARGKRRTVEDTPEVRRMINRGYVRQVRDATATEHAEQRGAEVLEAARREDDIAPPPPEETRSTEPPLGALKSEWVRYGRHLQVPDPEALTKAELIAACRNMASDSLHPEHSPDDDLTAEEAAESADS